MMRIDPWLVLGQIRLENWLLLAVCTLAFVIFYWRDYRRWGALSFASYFFGFNFFLKIVVMYPFAWSAHNIVATSRHFEAILAHIDTALYLTLIGFVCMVIGILVARVVGRRPPIGCEIVYAILARGWNSSGGVILGTGMVAGLTLLLFALGFEPLVARSLVFERNELRPIYNLWSQIVPFVAVGVILYGDTHKRWPIVALGLGIAMLGVLGGNRTIAVLTLIQVAVMVCMPRRFGNLPLLALGAVALTSGALSISILRGDSVSGREQLDMIRSLLYGNNLSDLRDFAWILTGLDAVDFYWGKTYIAGYLSFIPTYLFPFREQYGFGRVTPMLAGLDPAFHSGLRPPIFGEMYVNFGLPGLCIGGFVYGIMVGRIMHWITGTLDIPPGKSGYVPQIVVWSGFVMLQLVDSLVFTPAFFGVYVLLGLLFLGRLLARLGTRRA
jgi:hypothetical protein